MSGWEILAWLLAWVVGGGVLGVLVGHMMRVGDDPLFHDEDARW